MRPEKCGGCHESLNRGSQISVCAHCDLQAHPKCALTIPKTCGLPPGFAKHYSKSLTDSDRSGSASAENSLGERQITLEGWVKIPK